MNKQESINKFLDVVASKKEQTYKINDEFFFEDQFLDKYKEMGYTIKFSKSNNKNNSQSAGSNNINNTNKDYKYFVLKWNNLEFLNKIDNIEKSIYHKHKIIFSVIINKPTLKQMIEDYVFYKHKFKEYDVFIIGAELHINKLEYINHDVYQNKLPREYAKKDKIYIRIDTKFIDYMKDAKEIISYIDFITSNYLKSNGSLIIYSALLFPNEHFYNFFLKLINRFAYTTVFFPTYFMNNITNGFIILKKFNNQTIKILNIADKLATYFEKINMFLLGEYQTYDNLLTIRYNSENMFDIIIKKYISESMLKYNLSKFKLLEQ